MTEFTKRIAAGEDDCFVVNDGTGFDNTNGRGYLGNQSNDPIDNGLRFTNVTIPQGSTIDNAKITFYSPSGASTSNCKVIFSAVDEDNYGGFSDVVGDRPNDVTITTANVSWTLPTTTTNVTFDSPEIKTIIQEIVDRGGWSSGNALSIVIKDDSSANLSVRQFKSYNWSTTQCALLTINYTEAVGDTFIPKVMII